MAIRDFFSQRKAQAAKAGQAEVFQYDKVPQTFRAQVLHIIKRTIGAAYELESFWAHMRRTLAEAHGLVDLPPSYSDFEHFNSWTAYFYEHPETVKVLDAIEQAFAAINVPIRAMHGDYRFPSLGDADEAIADLNKRFREHAIGYEFNADANQLIEVNSQYMHAEAVKPALHLLNAKGFSGPQEEFLKAHKHYREGDYKAAVNEAAKALESTLKAICAAQKWPFDKNKHTAKDLIGIVLSNGLIPAYLENSLSGLRSVLEGMVPTSRNRSGSSHGQGSEPVAVPEHLAAYVLHATASNIVFLVESHRAMK